MNWNIEMRAGFTIHEATEDQVAQFIAKVDKELKLQFGPIYTGNDSSYNIQQEPRRG